MVGQPQVGWAGARSTGRRLAVAAAVLFAVLALLAPAPAAAQRAGHAYIFTACDFSHRAADDPIVFPGMPGVSHSHDFIANRTTDAFSTHDSLVGAETTCEREADTAAYWAPTLFDGRRAVAPRHASIYYLTQSKDRDAIQAFPAGLQMIAGDAKGRSTRPDVVDWFCDLGVGLPTRGPVPYCVPNGLTLRISFPDCWDGVHLDTADHKSHMEYADWSDRGNLRVCPESHPVPVPQIHLYLSYRTAGGDAVSLASGPPRTAHADFMNAWDQQELEDLVERCLRRDRACFREPDDDR
jgi:hypothetical protein